jgi:hypothetical protein
MAYTYLYFSTLSTFPEISVPALQTEVGALGLFHDTSLTSILQLPNGSVGNSQKKFLSKHQMRSHWLRFLVSFPLACLADAGL